MIRADPRPLAGVTVIDLTRVLAGPYCTLILANLGARVIKVERPPVGDDARLIGPFVGGKSLYFSALNYGKESIALELRRDEDRAVFDALLGAADVLVENFRPGVLERLGYGWATLHARWPRLVYAAASGFGHTGPLRERPAFDMVAQAMGGILSLTGYPDQLPARVGVSIGDIAAGLFLAVGIASALLKRRDTGAGTMIDVAMLDCQLAILENALTNHLVTGVVPGRLGTRHPNIAPFQAFATGDGRMIVVCAGHPEHFEKLCRTIDRPELLDDPRFVSPDLRRLHADALEGELESVLGTRPAAEWLGRFEEVGIPCAPVNTVAEAARSPQVEARRMVVGIPDSAIGTLFVAGNPIKLAGVPEPAAHRPPPDPPTATRSLRGWEEDRPRNRRSDICRRQASPTGGAMSRSVLVIGAQGFLGSFIARAFANDGWRVTRGGRRAETAADFRLVDLDRAETVRDAAGEVDLVVSTVRHPGLAAERAVLRDGGTLLHPDDLPAAERARLKREVREPTGLVVDRSGLGGVGNLALVELLEQHPEADVVEYGVLVSAAEAAGRAGGVFVHRLLAGPARHATAGMQLPDPFGRRRCIEAGPAADELLGEVAGARTARVYLCFLPAAFNGAMLALNALGIASRLPLAVFTVGRGRAPSEPSGQQTCHWVNVRRGDELLASRFIRGEGDYRMTVAATGVFPDALVPEAGPKPPRKGVFGVDEMFRLAPCPGAGGARHHSSGSAARSVPRGVPAGELRVPVDVTYGNVMTSTDSRWLSTSACRRGIGLYCQST